MGLQNNFVPHEFTHHQMDLLQHVESNNKFTFLMYPLNIDIFTAQNGYMLEL